MNGKQAEGAGSPNGDTRDTGPAMSLTLPGLGLPILNTKAQTQKITKEPFSMKTGTSGQQWLAGKHDL